MRAIRQNRTSKCAKRQVDRLVGRLAAAFMSLVIVIALLATGCSVFDSGQTGNGVTQIVGSTHQNRALKVRIDSLCWSWKSKNMPVNGETGAFSIEVEVTIKNEGKCKLHPPIFYVDGGGLVSQYQPAHTEDITRGKEFKLRIDNSNQVHLEFNDNDPGKEILLTVRATDQWGEICGLSIMLPPPLQMPVCSE